MLNLDKILMLCPDEPKNEHYEYELDYKYFCRNVFLCFFKNRICD